MQAEFAIQQRQRRQHTERTTRVRRCRRPERIQRGAELRILGERTAQTVVSVEAALRIGIDRGIPPGCENVGRAIGQPGGRDVRLGGRHHCFSARRRTEQRGDRAIHRISAIESRPGVRGRVAQGGVGCFGATVAQRLRGSLTEETRLAQRALSAPPSVARRFVPPVAENPERRQRKPRSGSSAACSTRSVRRLRLRRYCPPGAPLRADRSPPPVRPGIWRSRGPCCSAPSPAC